MKSLMLEQPRQMDLIPEDQMPADFFKPELSGREGESTGELVFLRDPQRYRLALTMLANQIGILRIAHVTGLHPCTVMAIRDREGGTIEILKQGISRAARFGAQLCVEGIIEALSDPATRAKLHPRDMAVIHGILVEKSELLSGGATQRIEFKPGALPSLDEFNKFIDALPRAEVLEMRQSGETPATKGPALPPAAGAQDGADPGLGPAAGEHEDGAREAST